MESNDKRANWYQQMFESTSSAIFVYTLDGKLIDINPAACALHGWSREEMLSKSPADFIAPSSIAVFDAFREAMRRGEEYRGEARGLRSDGTTFDVDVYGVPIELDGQRFAFSSLTDITETVRLREKLAEAQRLDALGRLAGGVAHDFNNMLTVILGSAEFARRATDMSVLTDALDEIHAASLRARDLTMQLMSFSRHRAIRRQRVDLSELFRNIIPLLARVLPENVVFDVRLDGGPYQVEGEPAPLEQVVVNLILNARDALDGRAGRIALRAKTRHVDEWTVPELAAGTYVELAIEDDGVGMNRATMAHIFEPFFTTKGTRGTGLGLASAYGIVRQHGGCVVVHSKPGKGTTFRVYLPALDEAPSALEARVEEHEVEERRLELEELSVVVVDDDKAVREVVVRAVEKLGATCIDAPPEHAGRIVRAARPDVLITDVVMPNEDGARLAARLRQDNPDLRVLYVSGYSADHLSRGGLLPPDVEVLPKPFTVKELAGALQRLLRHTTVLEGNRPTPPPRRELKT